MSEDHDPRRDTRFALTTFALGVFMAGLLVTGNILLGMLLFGAEDSLFLVNEIRVVLLVSSVVSVAYWVAVMAIWSKSAPGETAPRDAQDSAP